MEPSIRKQLVRLMRARGLSQSALSRATGVPQPTINRILSQATQDLRRDSVVRIAKYFNVTPESLYLSNDNDSAQAALPLTGIENTNTSETMDDICRRVMSLTTLQRAEILQRIVEMVVVK